MQPPTATDSFWLCSLCQVWGPAGGDMAEPELGQKKQGTPEQPSEKLLCISSPSGWPEKRLIAGHTTPKPIRACLSYLPNNTSLLIPIL